MIFIFLDRVKYVALFQSNLFKPFTSKRYSRKKDFQLIVKKVRFYRSKLGFPKKTSKHFKSLSKELRHEVRQFYLTKRNLSQLYHRCCEPDSRGESSDKDDEDTDNDDEETDSDEEFSNEGDTELPGEDNKCREEEVSLPWLDIEIAKSKRYEFVSSSLLSVLTSMEKTAIKIFKESAANADNEI